jgi:predicted transcriptional regulator
VFGRSTVPPSLDGLELEVMGAVWALAAPDTTVRDVADRLNDGRDPALAYTTFQTTMVRLEGKGLLARAKAGKTVRYTPAMGAEEYHAARAPLEVDALLARHGDAAVAHFAKRLASVDPARRAELERLARE